MTDYLIVGNGVAGTTAAENILNKDREAKITILTEEDTPFYNRMKLNDLVSKELTEEKLIMKKDSWYRDNNIDIRLNTRIVTADPNKRSVTAESGSTFSYDRLLLATGSHSFIPPIKGSDQKGVVALRNINDARKISELAEKVDNVVLIGGGLLGLESGKALRNLGKSVTVVEFFPRLLPRQLDLKGAKVLEGIMGDMGFSFRLGAKTEEIAGETGVKEVLLEGGEALAAEMVVISAGVRPNMELAGPLGLEKDKGVKVNDFLRTSVDDIFAAGDVAEYRGMPYGIWPASMEQGRIAGVNMAGGNESYSGTTMANILKVVGVDLASAGDIDAEEKLDSEVFSEGNIYKKLVFDKGRITGCIMLGDTKDFSRITKAMNDNRDVSQIRHEILKNGLKG